MPLNPSRVHSLKKVFQEGFVVHDIAEPLISFDGWSPVDRVRDFMVAGKYEVLGIRREGLVEGIVELDALEDGICQDCMRPFEPELVISESTPLADVVLRLKNQRYLFVSILGRIGGIVSRSDLEKPPVRMWLFGMVTLIEMRFSRMIDKLCPDGTWRQFLSDGRINKAEDLLAERRRRNQKLGLLDCLQFSDKGQIFARNSELRDLTQFKSRKQIEDAFKGVERLRNNLAHAQDIHSDWDMIVLLAENLERVVEGSQGFRELEGKKEWN
jgi:hypothetical protein